MASETPPRIRRAGDGQNALWFKGRRSRRSVGTLQGSLNGRKIGRRCRRIGGRGWFRGSRGFADSLAKFCNLLSELDDLMLRVRICGFFWDPGLHMLCDDLGNVLGVVGLVHKLPILPSFGHRDAVDVETAALKLFEQLRHEHH